MDKSRILSQLWLQKWFTILLVESIKSSSLCTAVSCVDSKVFHIRTSERKSCLFFSYIFSELERTKRRADVSLLCVLSCLLSLFLFKKLPLRREKDQWQNLFVLGSISKHKTSTNEMLLKKKFCLSCWWFIWSSLEIFSCYLPLPPDTA